MLLIVIDLVIKIVHFGWRAKGVDWRQTALACVFKDSLILTGDFSSWVAVFLPKWSPLRCLLRTWQLVSILGSYGTSRCTRTLTPV